MGKIIFISEEYSKHVPNMNHTTHQIQNVVYSGNGSATGFYVNVPAPNLFFQIKIDSLDAYIAWNCKPGDERNIRLDIDKRTFYTHDDRIYSKFFNKTMISDFIENNIEGTVFFRRKHNSAWDFIFENITQHSIFVEWFNSIELPSAKIDIEESNIELAREWLAEINDRARSYISNKSYDYKNPGLFYEVMVVFEKEVDRMNFLLRWMHCPVEETE